MNTLKKLIKNEPFIAIGGAIALVLSVAVLVIVVAATPKPIDSSMILNESGELVERAPLEPSGQTIDNKFNCADGKSIITKYDLGSNALTVIISPEVSYVLPQDITPDGAKYSTVDGSIIYTENNGQATLTEQGQVTYRECVAQ